MNPRDRQNEHAQKTQASQPPVDRSLPSQPGDASTPRRSGLLGALAALPGLAQAVASFTLVAVVLELQPWFPDLQPSYYFGTRQGRIEALQVEESAEAIAKAEALKAYETSVIAGAVEERKTLQIQREVAAIENARNCNETRIARANEAKLQCEVGGGGYGDCIARYENAMAMPCPEMPELSEQARAALAEFEGQGQ